MSEGLVVASCGENSLMPAKSPVSATDLREFFELVELGELNFSGEHGKGDGLWWAVRVDERRPT